MISCSKCRIDFIPTENHIKKQSHVCLACMRIYDANHRKRRKEAGRPVKTGKHTPEYEREYRAKYLAIEENRLHRNAKMRERMKKEHEKFRSAARRKTRTALESGVLVRLSCEVCGNSATDAHHEDYSRPLDVKWLCRRHHRERHTHAQEAPP
jgi:hypothetical protein